MMVPVSAQNRVHGYASVAVDLLDNIVNFKIHVCTGRAMKKMDMATVSQ
jgi:hypothetical protein